MVDSYTDCSGSVTLLQYPILVLPALRLLFALLLIRLLLLFLLRIPLGARFAFPSPRRQEDDRRVKTHNLCISEVFAREV